MKIQLTEDLPVHEKHGMTKGRVFEVLRIDRENKNDVWVRGDADEDVKVFWHEYQKTEG
jgi:hypothetical protein